MELTLSWIFGGLAMLSLFIAYQNNDRKRLITCKLCADVCWVFHYFFLGAYGGMIPNFVGIFREIICSHRDTWRFADNKIWVFVVLALNWTLGLLTFSEPINILPIVASSFVTISLWLRNPKITKLIIIPVCITYLIYDLVIGSYIGALNESISIVSIIISFVKLFIQSRRNRKNEN